MIIPYSYSYIFLFATLSLFTISLLLKIPAVEEPLLNSFVINYRERFLSSLLWLFHVITILLFFSILLVYGLSFWWDFLFIVYSFFFSALILKPWCLVKNINNTGLQIILNIIVSHPFWGSFPSILAIGIFICLDLKQVSLDFCFCLLSFFSFCLYPIVRVEIMCFVWMVKKASLVNKNQSYIQYFISVINNILNFKYKESKKERWTLLIQLLTCLLLFAYALEKLETLFNLFVK